MTQKLSLVWFRQDLRLSDNMALSAAAKAGAPCAAVYILDDVTAKEWKLGGAQRWWLHHSLCALRRTLDEQGIPLLQFSGAADKVWESIVQQLQPSAVYWNRVYEPSSILRDKKIKASLKQQGIEAHSFNISLLIEPCEIRNKQGKPFRVFTPFWKHCLTVIDPGAPLPVPKLTGAKVKIASESLEDWDLLPTHPDWSGGIAESWTVGEDAAKSQLSRFLRVACEDYKDARNRPDTRGTSRMSPYLHWGEISPRQIWAKVQSWKSRHSEHKGADCFLSELGWREFSYYLLYHHLRLPTHPFDPKFEAFDWEKNPRQLEAWQKGQTGYPIVDAGMRELWHTGWMHNRVRMIVASFLTKDLLIHWIEGAKWFWDTLVDADLANNSAGWQWTAGCGADAAPYFRVFNPVLQGERFDPEGEYVRKWCPELAELPKKWIHKPWEAKDFDLDYPNPIVDHKVQRDEALRRFKLL